jgi:hypothetical protein
MTLTPCFLRQLRPRLSTAFRHANTWLIIAWLALIGWTADALRLFLGMHATLWAGLGAFVNHFWYVVPITLAIVVLTRRQPRAHLLGLTVYDEAGRPVYRQGDVFPDEATSASFINALPAGTHQGLHGLTLPSGASLYFVRTGNVTALLCFSAPASLPALDEAVRRLGRSTVRVDLLEGLSAPVTSLAADLLGSPLKRGVLSFFRDNDRLAVGRDDLAGRLRADPAAVAHVLEGYVRLGLIQRQAACGMTFYQLTRDAAVRAQLDELFAWRARWEQEITRLEGMLR